MRHKGQTHWFSSSCPPPAPEISPTDSLLFYFFTLSNTFSSDFPSLAFDFAYLLIWRPHCRTALFVRVFIFVSSSVAVHPPLSLLCLCTATSLSTSFPLSLTPPLFRLLSLSPHSPSLLSPPPPPLLSLCATVPAV